jgi:long-chain acyl-CoA synthetase
MMGENGIPSAAMETQLDYCYRHEKARPNDVWLTQPRGRGVVKDFTWAEAMSEIRAMAAHLVSLDLPRGSKIALFSKNCAWWFFADLAIWMAGHVTVPLYPTLTRETIRLTIEHSESRLIFVGKLDAFEGMKGGIPEGLPIIVTPLGPKVDREGARLWDDIVATTKPLETSPTREPDELATIIYTSGSTGTPKGVMHSFRTMCAGLSAIEEYGITSNDRMLSYLPLAHVLERLVVELPSIAVPMRIYFAESLDTFVSDIRRARPTIFISVPRLWSKFQQGVFAKMPPGRLALMLRIPILRTIIGKKVKDGLGLGDVRLAISGSAPIPADLLDWYRSLGLELLEGYGMTENFAVSHATKLGEVRVGYVGSVRPGVEQKLLESGELLVKSPGNMLGYYKDEALTREVLDAEGFVHTGDRGEMDAKGRLKITGRVKELFKTSKGKYVAPSPIENLLLLHVDVEQALVSGASMPQPFGLVVLSDAARARLGAGNPAEKGAFIESLEAHLDRTNAALDPHEHLEKVVVARDPWTIENGMLTPTMKVKRAAIEARYAAQVDAWYAGKARILWD